MAFTLKKITRALITEDELFTLLAARISSDTGKAVSKTDIDTIERDDEPGFWRVVQKVVNET